MKNAPDDFPAEAFSKSRRWRHGDFSPMRAVYTVTVFGGAQMHTGVDAEDLEQASKVLEHPSQ